MMPVTAPPTRRQHEEQVEQVSLTYRSVHRAVASNRHVVVVEGDDDKDTLEGFIDARRRTGPATKPRAWGQHVYIVAAGGRKRVLKWLNHEPDWFGLVDRDTWTEQEVQEEQLRYGGRLFVTRGWCLENDLLVEHAPRLEYARDAWVRAGALWWSLQRLREDLNRTWDGLWEIGPYGAPPPFSWLDSADLQRELSQASAPGGSEDASLFWKIANQAAARHARVGAMSVAEQWLHGVHGKQAWASLLRQPSADDEARARYESATQTPVPAPLDVLLAMILP